jgi:hypothetical protein
MVCRQVIRDLPLEGERFGLATVWRGVTGLRRA